MGWDAGGVADAERLGEWANRRMGGGTLGIWRNVPGPLRASPGFGKSKIQVPVRVGLVMETFESFGDFSLPFQTRSYGEQAGVCTLEYEARSNRVPSPSIKS